MAQNAFEYDRAENDPAARLLRGEASPEEARRLVRALLLADDKPDTATTTVNAGTATSTADADGYDNAITAAATHAAAAATAIAAERAAAPALVDSLTVALDREPLEEVCATVKDDARYHNSALSYTLRDRAFAAGADDPQRAVALSRLAVVAAEGMTEAPAIGKASGVGKAPDRRFKADTRAAAWAQLGNAQRVAAEHRAAGTSFATAHQQLDQGSGDPLIRGQLASFEASRLSNLARFDDAIAHAQRAMSCFRRAGDRHQQGRTLIQLANFYAYAERLPEAVRSLERGIKLVDQEEEPRLLLVAIHNLVSYLDKDGQHDRAWARLAQARILAQRLGGRIDQVKCDWLEGCIAANRGASDHAAACWIKARDAFISHDLGYDAALVSMDLAGLYATQGQRNAMRRLAAEMVPLFQARDIHRKAQAALEIFCRAAREEAVALELVNEVADYLEAARGRPDLAFRA